MSLFSFKDSDEKKAGKFLGLIIGSLLTVFLVEWLWPDVIPFGLFEFWRFDGTIGEVLSASWPIFAWGIGLTTIKVLTTRNDKSLNRQAESVLMAGCFISGFA